MWVDALRNSAGIPTQSFCIWSYTKIITHQWYILGLIYVSWRNKLHCCQVKVGYRTIVDLTVFFFWNVMSRDVILLIHWLPSGLKHPWLDAHMRPWAFIHYADGRISAKWSPWSPEATRFGFRLVQSLWNVTGTSAAVLPRCLSNFRAIRKL